MHGSAANRFSQMRRMRELLTSLGPGDAAYICGLQLEPDMDLTGRQAGEPGYEALVDLLAGLASDGVDVRVILAGADMSPDADINQRLRPILTS